MRTIQRTLLHFGAYISLLLAVYPVIALVYHYSGGTSGEVWLSEGFAVVTGLIALLHAILVRRYYRRKPVLVNAGFFGAGALLAVIAFSMSPIDVTFVSALMSIVVFGIYQAGTRLFFVEYDVLTHTYVYTGIAVVFALTTALIWIDNPDASFLWQTVVFLVISAVFSVARNFCGIDTALISQGDEDTPFPKGLLCYNRLLLCAVGGVILILILLRKYIGGLLWTVVKALIQLIGGFLHWFLGLFLGEKRETADLTYSKSEFFTSTSVSRNEWVDLIFMVILAVIVVFILIKYRTRLIAAVQRLIGVIGDFISRLFGRSYEKKSFTANGGYIDYHTRFNAEEIETSCESDKKSFRYSREYRRFRRMENGIEKYRLGYSLFLEKLRESGTPIDKAMSPSEVRKRLPESFNRKDLAEQVTTGYEHVRYGENLPESFSMEALETLLREKF